MHARAHCVSLAHLAPTNLFCKYARLPRHVADDSVGRIENTKMLSPIHKTMTLFEQGMGDQRLSPNRKRLREPRPQGHATIIFPCSAPFLVQLRLSVPSPSNPICYACVVFAEPSAAISSRPARHSLAHNSVLIPIQCRRVWCLQ